MGPVACLIGSIAMAMMTGCSVLENLGGYCRGPDRVVAPASDSAPGSLRAGTSIRTYRATIAPRTDGSVLCLTCEGVVIFDDELREIGRLAESGVDGLALGPDETVYVTVSGIPDGMARPHELVAYEADGRLRWRTTLPDGVPLQLVAAAEGPYVELSRSFSEPDVWLAFDAVTGQLTRELDQRVLAAAGSGVFAVAGAPERDPMTVIQHLDPAGAVVWSRTLRAASQAIYVRGAVVGQGGELIVSGYAPASVELGDRTLEGASLGFVAAFDTSGATLWAFATAEPVGDHLAVTLRGDLVLAGSLRRAEDGSDGFVAVARPAGLVRRHVIDGPASQDIQALAALGDRVLVQVHNYHSEDQPDPVLHIAGREFDDGGSYLFALVP